MAWSHSHSKEYVWDQNEIFYYSYNFGQKSVSSNKNQLFVDSLNHENFETVSI